MNNQVLFRMVLYALAAGLPVFVMFFADQFEIWKLDNKVVFSVPWFVWLYLFLASAWQIVIALKAYMDGTYAKALPEEPKTLLKPQP